MSSSDVSSVVSYFSQANEGFITTTAGSVSPGASSVALNTTSGLTNGAVFVGIIEPGVTGNEQTFTGTVDTGGSQIISVVWTRGTNVSHSGGVTVVDYVTGTAHNMITAGILKQHTQSGHHTGITTDTLTASSSVTTANLTASGGVSLPPASVAASTLATGIAASKLTNGVKFSVYRNASTTSSSTAIVIPFDTKTFDTGSNVDIVTNKGRFTAPAAGFYYFTAVAGNTAAGATPIYTYLFKNGSLVKAGNGAQSAANGTYSSVSGMIQCSTNDFIEVYFIGGNGSTMAVGATSCWFEGFLVSTT